MPCQSCFHLIPGNDKGPVDLRSQAEGEEEEEGKATRYQQLAMGFFWGMVAPGCSRMSRADPHQDVSWKLPFASILELSPSNPALLFQSLLLASFSRHQGRLAILPPFWGTMLIMQEYFKEISKGLEPLTTYNHPPSPLLSCVRGSPQPLTCLGLHASVLCLPHQARPTDADVVKCPDRILTAEGLSPC